MSDYYYLEPTAMESLELDLHCTREAEMSWLCDDCGGILPQWDAPIDIGVSRRRLPSLGLCYAAPGMLGVISRKLLDHLDPELVASSLHLGRITLQNGRVEPEYLTYHGRNRITVRGTRSASHRRCDQCGASLYFAAGVKYLHPAPPPEVALWTESGAIVMTAAAYVRANIPRMRGVGVTRIRVVDAPKDGLPELNATDLYRVGVSPG